MERLRRWLRKLGPGLVTGASDDDPSGIGTYAQAGAAFGFATLWTAGITVVMMIAVQDMCARIGIVSRQGLAAVLRHHYPRWLLALAVSTLFVANTINIAADLGAIAYGLNLITGIPANWLGLPVAIVILSLQVFGSYRLIAGIFKWLTLSLFAYVLTPFFLHLDWATALKSTLIPHLRWEAGFLLTMVALWGTTISPYLFFWQTDMEVEEEASRERQDGAPPQSASPPALREARTDVIAGMLASNLVMFFIILTTGATLHPAGITDIQTAQQAAEALRPLAGDLAYALFATGLIGTGMLAVPVLAGSAAYAIAEAFGWPSSLNAPWRREKPFYGVLAAGILLGALLDTLGFNAIKALFWTAVLNGITAPPLLVVVMLVANDRRVMGAHVNGRLQNLLGWLTVVIMSLMAFGLIVSR